MGPCIARAFVCEVNVFITGGFVSPLRAAWLAYTSAEFDKDWKTDKELAEAKCNAKWLEYEKQLLLFKESRDT
jgi:hypothetical protein